MQNRYVFTILYVWIEKILLQRDIKKDQLLTISEIILVNFSFNPGEIKKTSKSFADKLEKSLISIDEFNVVQTIYTTI